MRALARRDDHVDLGIYGAELDTLRWVCHGWLQDALVEGGGRLPGRLDSIRDVTALGLARDIHEMLDLLPGVPAVEAARPGLLSSLLTRPRSVDRLPDAGPREPDHEILALVRRFAAQSDPGWADVAQSSATVGAGACGAAALVHGLAVGHADLSADEEETLRIELSRRLRTARYLDALRSCSVRLTPRHRASLREGLRDPGLSGRVALLIRLDGAEVVAAMSIQDLWVVADLVAGARAAVQPDDDSYRLDERRRVDALHQDLSRLAGRPAAPVS